MMSAFRLSEIQSLLKANLFGVDKLCEFVVTDSRDVPKNALFVAIKGERFDGHDFVSDLNSEHHAALVSIKQDTDVSQLQVDDTLLALGQIAGLQRRQFTKPVIGLTGSCGKTSTKEMIAAVLAEVGDVFSTKGNLNNEIGVPKTLLSLEPQHDFAVIEMGAAEKGDIAYLCQFVNPDVSLVTNVHEAHIGRFGSLQNIVETKGEIYQHMNQAGTALLNLDDAAANYWQQHCVAERRLTFAIDNEADIRAFDIKLSAQHTVFKVKTPKAEFVINLQVPGRHFVYNALVAIAVSYLFEVPVEKVQQALAAFKPVSGRGQFLPGFQGSTIIDETYNSNPGALKSAIDLLVAQDVSRKILVMADMAELGELSAKLHTEVGTYAREKGVSQLLAFGDESMLTVSEFGESARHFSDKQQLIDCVKDLLDENVAVLVKGSRSMKMEEVVTALLAKEAY